MREPEGVLGEIVRRKRADVAARFGSTPLDAVRGRAGPTTRSLKAALSRPGARFVLEVKRASPSQGALRQGLEPEVAARAYRGVADAVSVLTDGPYFGGSFEDLRAVRAELDAPVLCKDFMVDLRQVAEARAHGADAVLVMLSVLDDAEAAAMIAEARRFGMDALVEAHTAEEVDRAVALGAEVVGLNNRDLRTLQIDLAVTEALADRVPADRVLVTESGIEDRADVKRLAPIADAFLVGSSLMRQPDLADAARQLAFGRVKVCGLTRPEQAVAARGAGATFGGMIFAEDSPRFLTRDAADGVSDAMVSAGLSQVGVFRNGRVDVIASLAREYGLDAVQLHGSCADDQVLQLRRVLPGKTEIWGAVGVDIGSGGLEDAPLESLERVVFDASVRGRSGGTGERFDWSLLADWADLDWRAVLAGGLNPGNARAADAVGAWALDVNSGVEDAPGVKSEDKLQRFFDALRPVSRQEVA